MSFLRRRPPAIPMCPHCPRLACWLVTGFHPAGPVTAFACEYYARRLEHLWGQIVVKGI